MSRKNAYWIAGEFLDPLDSVQTAYCTNCSGQFFMENVNSGSSNSEFNYCPKCGCGMREVLVDWKTSVYSLTPGEEVVVHRKDDGVDIWKKGIFCGLTLDDDVLAQVDNEKKLSIWDVAYRFRKEN